MRKLILILFLSSQFIQLSAQRALYDWKLGVGSGLTGYAGDVPQTDLLDYSDNHYFLLFAERAVGQSFSLKWQGQQQTFTANDLVLDGGIYSATASNFQRALNCSTTINSAQMTLQWYSDNGRLFSKRALLAPYIFGGIGLASFSVYGDLYQDNGNPYYYTENAIYDLAISNPDAQSILQDGHYETQLTGLQTEGVDYATTVWFIPAGIGLKWRMSDRINLDFTGGMSWYFSDYLDDVHGEYDATLLDYYPANPSMTGSGSRGNTDAANDKLWHIGLNLSINLDRRKNNFIINPIQAPHDHRMEATQINEEIEGSENIEETTIEMTDKTYREMDTLSEAGMVDSKTTEEASKKTDVVEEQEETPEASPRTGQAIKEETTDQKTKEKKGKTETSGGLTSSRSIDTVYVTSQTDDSFEKIEKELESLRNLVIGLYGAEVVGTLLNRSSKDNAPSVATTDSIAIVDTLAIPIIDSLAIPDGQWNNESEVYANKQKQDNASISYAQFSKRLTLTEIMLSELIQSQKDIQRQLSLLEMQTPSVVRDTVILEKATDKPVTRPEGVIATIYFTSGKVVTGLNAIASIEQAINIWKMYPDQTLQIVGYADQTGSSDKNLVMGKLRAAAVQQYLIGQGVPAGKIQIKSLGDSVSPAGANPLFRKAEIRFMAD